MTYISETKFQFITDFSKHVYQNNNKIIELNFANLTIDERVILSGYLTLLCNNNKINKENIFDIIFNFNKKNKNNNTTYYKTFIDDITTILQNKIEFMVFIKNNFDLIENNKTVIYRQQLNASQMDVVYSIKFQRSYQHLMNILYIIGVAKQNITTSTLNKIELKRFYKTNSTMSKKLVENIFEKINKKSENQVKYIIDNKDNIVYFGNGFNISLNNE